MSNSNLCKMLPPKLKNMTSRYKVMCGCEGFNLFAKNMYPSLLSWHEGFFKTIKYKSCNVQNRKSSEMTNTLLETYTNSVMPHGNHMFQTAYYM